MQDVEVEQSTALAEDNLVNAVFASAVAGGVWMGLGGLLLGLALLIVPSALRNVYQGDLTMAGSIGLFVAANGGVIAGVAHAAVDARHRTLATTIVAGLCNPFLQSSVFHIVGDASERPGSAALSLCIVMLPFLFGWLFARAMTGSGRIPLISWARRNVGLVPDGLPWNRRASALIWSGIPAWLVVMAGAAAFAFAFSRLETLLPLPQRPPMRD